MQLRSFGLPLATVLLSSLLAGPVAAAQTSPSASASVHHSHIAGDWRSTAPVAIPNSKPPVNLNAPDLGAAASNQVLGRMLLLLAPAPAQQQALAAELASLQNPSSPDYHRWLTPSEFAQAYANSPSDVAAVTAWLESEGFTVAPLPAGLGWIEFSGTVAQVEQAFGAEIHLVATPGGTRLVLTTGISVPGALAPLVAGLVSLDGAVSTPALTAPAAAHRLARRSCSSQLACQRRRAHAPARRAASRSRPAHLRKHQQERRRRNHRHRVAQQCEQR